MTIPIPDLFANAILKREKRRSEAKAVLSRPGSALPMLFGGPLVAVAIASYIDVRSLSGPVFNALLSFGLVSLIALAFESWAIRRRLEAAIVLLELQQVDAGAFKNPIK